MVIVHVLYNEFVGLLCDDPVVHPPLTRCVRNAITYHTMFCVGIHVMGVDPPFILDLLNM